MRRVSYPLLRIALTVAAIPPIGFGVAAMIDARHVQSIIRLFSGALATPTPELNYLLKPLGIYLIAFGLMLLVAMMDPVRHRTLITLGSLVLLARGLQRLSLGSELNRLFHISAEVNFSHGAYLLLMAGILLVLRPPPPNAGVTPS